MVAQTYQTASRHLLTQAREELAAGDTRQASQKGWAAAAQIVKSVAVRRGWAHHDHAALYNVISRLASETGDDDIRSCSRLPSASRQIFMRTGIMPRTWPATCSIWSDSWT